MGSCKPELTKKNAVKEYVSAKSCCDTARKTAALEFTCQNFKDVSADPSFVQLLSCDQLMNIISSVQLVANTKLVFEAVVCWANHDYHCRGGDDLEALLKAIPFAAAANDEEKTYVCNPVICRSSRLKKLVCELWKAAEDQRPRPCEVRAPKPNSVWYGDITKQLKCPIKSAERSFFVVRQGYLFEVATTTHEHFAKHNKGLEVYLRVRRAETGWNHSNSALRQLHVKAKFWINTGCNKEHYVVRKTFEQDLLNIKDGAEWFGWPALLSCEQLCDIVDSDKVLVGFYIDIQKICTAGPCPTKKVDNACCTCAVCCKKKEDPCKGDVCKKKEDTCKKQTCDCCCVCKVETCSKCTPPKKDAPKEKCCCIKGCEDACKKKCCDLPCCKSKKKDCEAKCEKDCAGKCEHKCSCCPDPKKKKPDADACSCAKCKPKEKKEPACSCCKPKTDVCEKPKDKKCPDKCTCVKCCVVKKHDNMCCCVLCTIKATKEVCKPKTKSCKVKCTCTRLICICC
jgi:BTB And C-terminal Kelch